MLMFMCVPEPQAPASGFGMYVTSCLSATARSDRRYVSRSYMAGASACAKSSSCCSSPSSWSRLNTPIPETCMCPIHLGQEVE